MLGSEPLSQRLGFEPRSSRKPNMPASTDAGEAVVPQMRLQLHRNGDESTPGRAVCVGGSTTIQSLEQLAQLAAGLFLKEDEQAHFEPSAASFFLCGGVLLAEFELLRADDVIYVAFARKEVFGEMRHLRKPEAPNTTRAQLSTILCIRLEKVDFNQISEVNQVDQYFAARVYVEFVVVDGALDESLVAPGVVPPSSDRRPNAAWYLER